MKKKAVLVAYVALLATPVAVMAQYPQLTEEAKAKYDKDDNGSASPFGRGLGKSPSYY